MFIIDTNNSTLLKKTHIFNYITTVSYLYSFRKVCLTFAVNDDIFVSVNNIITSDWI